MLGTTELPCTYLTVNGRSQDSGVSAVYNNQASVISPPSFFPSQHPHNGTKRCPKSRASSEATNETFFPVQKTACRTATPRPTH
jgi:hypothetical protein